ncbi:MAG: chromophore lyase CpcT/CpeT [Woeseiaceae bacterium]
MRPAAILWLVAAAFVAPPAWCNDIDELAEMLTGTFDSRLASLDQIADHSDDHSDDQSDEQRFVDRRIRLTLPALGPYVFYQQINQHEDLEVYRQRVLVLRISETTGRIEQRAFSLRDAPRFVDADAGAFETIGSADLDDFMADGCEQVWTKMSGGYRGYVDPDTCTIISKRTGKLRSIESESLLTKDALALAERGFDAETGEQLFGTLPGAFLRLGRRAE